MGTGPSGFRRNATRLHFQEELAALELAALGGLDLVAQACERTLEALEHRDMELAAMVVGDDDRIDGRYLEVHQGVLSLLALQAPVATDLRTVAALLDVIRHVERMGDQCVNVAKLIPVAGHDPPVAAEILERVLAMGRQAASQIDQAKRAFARRDVELAQDLPRQDERINRLNREVFRAALGVADSQDAREWSMTMLLVARAFERIGDNAVDIGEQTAFVVTGLFREFTDASHGAPPGAVSGGRP